jgi:uncharacterized membrane protein YkvA (DUF1232 family)
VLRFLGDPKGSIPGKLFVALAVLYVIMPADLIPDIAPVIGWLDDLGVVGMAMVYLARVAGKYRDAPVAAQR